MAAPAQLWQAAQQHLARNDARAARAALEALVAAVPGHFHAHLLLGGLAHADGRLRAATRHALDAARVLPEDAGAIAAIVNALLLVGEMTRAHECLAHPAIARSTQGPVLAALASAQQMLGEHPAALRLLDRAIAAGLDNPDLRYLRGVQLTFNGRLEEAQAELEACLRMGPTYGRASVTLARLQKQTTAANHLAQIDARLARVPRGSEDHAAFEFARYKELEDLGRFDEAWTALTRGNAIMFARLNHDSAAQSRRVDALIARCGADFVRPSDASETNEDAADARHGGPQPIFIVGMPRSGTTVLERILGNHSRVTSAGELGDFARQLRWGADHVTIEPVDETILARSDEIDFAEVGRRYLAQTQWRALGKPWFVDKLPINFVQLGFIRRALPRARILHMTRDPLDVCFSNFKAFFGAGYAYSYDLGALAAQYRDYRRLMRHWHAVMPGQVLDVAYADLVEDPEAAARRVFEFCALDFEPGTIDISRNAGPVATLSTMQVREGIHTRARGEWQRYAAQLSPLEEELAAYGLR